TTMQELSHSDEGIPWRQEEPYVALALQHKQEPERSIAWANAQVSLGDAYADQVQGESSKNREQAIQQYDQALTVFTPELTPLLWASTLLRRAIVKHRWLPPSQHEGVHASGGGPFRALATRLP